MQDQWLGELTRLLKPGGLLLLSVHGEAAAKELYDTYVAHVLRCVRNRMWHRLRSKFDSQDFVQQVWASFFVGETKLPDFQTPDDLIEWTVLCRR